VHVIIIEAQNCTGCG